MYKNVELEAHRKKDDVKEREREKCREMELNKIDIISNRTLG